jgi:hypothetical protein
VPIWIYELHPFFSALVVIIFIETISLAGLLVTRRFLLRRFHYGEGANEVVSGTVQAIGVFYGITVGLIAVGVWNTNSNASDLVSKEATAIATLYRDVSGYPSPLREELRSDVRDYTVFLIQKVWPAQRKDQIPEGGTAMMDDFQQKLYTFAPANEGQIAFHQETLGAYNRLTEYRRMRIDAVANGLSSTMWAVIWIGAAISIGVAYLYRIEDEKLHCLLVAMMGGFLAIVLFMIVINDRPFYGHSSISPASYQLVLDRLIDLKS